VLESRYPVRVESFAVRRGSGGEGRWRGGDGAQRRIVFDEAMTLSILSGHRVVPPYGMAGGSPGALGHTWVERRDGTVTSLASADTTTVDVGDVLVVQTPGGGGYGTG
jgi:5-oxoprolinase (ATP-hydrolysing)